MKYELMVILKPLLPEDVKSGLIGNIESLITKYEGKIIATDVWGKRHLAYPINKHEEGYYIIYTMEMNSENVDEFDRQLKLSNGVLRHIRIREDQL